MLVEVIPKEPLSFSVFHYKNPKMQHTVQVSNSHAVLSVFSETLFQSSYWLLYHLWGRKVIFLIWMIWTWTIFFSWTSYVHPPFFLSAVAPKRLLLYSEGGGSHRGVLHIKEHFPLTLRKVLQCNVTNPILLPPTLFYLPLGFTWVSTSRWMLWHAHKGSSLHASIPAVHESVPWKKHFQDCSKAVSTGRANVW